MDSAVVAHRLSCSKACGILLTQGSNSRLLHWHVNSYPLSQQGRLRMSFYKPKNLPLCHTCTKIHPEEVRQ